MEYLRLLLRYEPLRAAGRRSWRWLGGDVRGLLHHIDHRRAGQALQVAGVQRKHAVRMARCGPDHVKAQQVLVDQRDGRGGVGPGRPPPPPKKNARPAQKTTPPPTPPAPTPPIEKPVRALTKSASARPILPTWAATFFSSTRRSPEVTTSTAASSLWRRKIMLLATCPTRMPSASAACCAVGAAASSICGIWAWPCACNAAATRCTASGKSFNGVAHMPEAPLIAVISCHFPSLTAPWRLSRPRAGRATRWRPVNGACGPESG